MAYAEVIYPIFDCPCLCYVHALTFTDSTVWTQFKAVITVTVIASWCVEALLVTVVAVSVKSVGRTLAFVHI